MKRNCRFKSNFAVQHQTAFIASVLGAGALCFGFAVNAADAAEALNSPSASSPAGVGATAGPGSSDVSSKSITQSLFEAAAAPAIPNISLQTLSIDQRLMLEKLGQKSIEDQAAAIKKEVEIELLSTTRKGGSHSFDFMGPAKRSVESITDIEGLYGKAACPKSDGKYKIYVVEDAPPFTLLHEYIHLLQMKADKRWCELDGRILEGDEKRERALLYHRFEFETLKTIWDFRDQFVLNFEDRLILVEGLNRENNVLKSIGVKALDDETATEVEKDVEDAQAQIHYLTWLSHSGEDAGTVMQKMEVIALKACVESSKDPALVKKVNDCVQKRCAYAKIKCQSVDQAELEKFKDDLYSQIIYAWLKPDITDDCPVTKLKSELTGEIELATPCWKSWYTSGTKPRAIAPVAGAATATNGSPKIKAKARLKPQALTEAALRQRFGAPKLAIDKKIAFYEITNPQSFINLAYCYFIFQRVARFDTLPIDQFAYATQGAALSLTQKAAYVSWLQKSSQGKSCSKLVKLFSGEEPSKLEGLGGGKSYVLFVNPEASLTGGMDSLSSTIRTDVNHERLHIVFAEDKTIAGRVRAEWQGLSEAERDDFKKKHGSYDFKDEQVLLKEYFSFTHQDHP